MVFGQKHTRTLDFYTLGCLAYEIMFGYPPFYSENHHDLSQKLLNEEVYFPKQVDKGAKDLIKWLLEKDPESRPSEFSEVKNHPFFEKVHWGKLARREVAPPFVPDLYKVNFERCFLEVPISQALNFKSLVEERKENDKTISDKNASNRNTNYKNYAKSVKLGRLSRNVDNELSITVQKENDPDWIEEFNFEVHPESEIIIRKQLNLAMKENLYPRCESAIPLQTYYTGN
mmetsp:Transcript_20063/g.19666  ORF Transcript_20063/g.19666 Transcript_20063/m.19666 type:complete len:230 (+) Transcript_20063:811-1500(+)